VEEQVVSIWAGGNGYLDDVPVEDVSRFETDFLDYLRRSHAGILQTIRESLALTEDTVTALKDAVEEFRKGFETSSGELLRGEDEESEPLENEVQTPDKKHCRYRQHHHREYQKTVIGNLAVPVKKGAQAEINQAQDPRAIERDTPDSFLPLEPAQLPKTKHQQAG
jgi:hypothetical protein